MKRIVVAAAALALCVSAYAQTSQQPEAEALIVNISNRYRSLYDSAPSSNEVKRTMIYDQRRSSLCSAFDRPDFKIKNWTGTISSMDTSSDGSVDVEIRLSDHVSISNDNTIPNESPLFVALASMSVGQRVRFSGTPIRKYRGCMGEGSLTEEGSMDDPEYVADIQDIRAIN